MQRYNNRPINSRALRRATGCAPPAKQPCRAATATRLGEVVAARGSLRVSIEEPRALRRPGRSDRAPSAASHPDSRRCRARRRAVDVVRARRPVDRVRTAHARGIRSSVEAVFTNTLGAPVHVATHTIRWYREPSVGALDKAVGTSVSSVYQRIFGSERENTPRSMVVDRYTMHCTWRAAVNVQFTERPPDGDMGSLPNLHELCKQSECIPPRLSPNPERGGCGVTRAHHRRLQQTNSLCTGNFYGVIDRHADMQISEVSRNYHS